MNRKAFLQGSLKAFNGPESPKKVIAPEKLYENKVLPSFHRNLSGLEPYTGPFGDAEKLHLLRRTLFGVRKTDLDALKSLNVSDAVAFLLNVPSAPPTGPLNNYTTLSLIDLSVPLGSPWGNAIYGDGTINAARRTSFKSWWTGLILNQETNIREKMTFFLHSLIATETDVIGDARFMYKHNALLRSYALGNYKTLIRKVTVDPGMLVYLNGERNSKAAPDENYARELQELFTLGKTNNPNYTEDDVKAAAKVLTGWVNDRNTIASTLNTARHDATNKQFSSYYNNKIINGGTTPSAINAEIDELINMIFSKDDVSKYIVRKIYTFFVYYVIDAEVETKVIEPLAQIFSDNNFELKPVLEALLSSAHFFEANTMGGYIKTPLDHIAGTLRSFELHTKPANTTVTDLYAYWNTIRATMAALQLDIGDPINVSGWPAFYQAPQYYEIWINSDTFPKRVSFCSVLMNNGIRGTKLDVLAYTSTLANPDNPNALINELINTHLVFPLSQKQIDIMKAALLAGQANDSYWTQAWTTYKANPTLAANINNVKPKLTAMYTYFFNLAEFQLC
jgi:hypothetical protein